MNVMLFSRILEKTGVGNHINLLSDALQKQGHHVIVVSGTQGIQLNNENVEFIKTDTLSRNPIKVFRAILHLRRIIREHSIQVVHCHHRVASIYMQIYNLFFKIPFVYSLHLANIPHDLPHRLLTFTGRCAIGVSSEVSRFLVEKMKVPAHKVVTVLNGVDETRVEPMSALEKQAVKEKWGIPADKLVVVLHSRIDPVKNHMLVVEAVHDLTEEERSKVVVVCSGKTGGRYHKSLEERIRQYGLESQFFFVGWVDARDVLGIADFMFMPSINEGFGLNVAEAFMMQVPVARTQTAGFEDLKYCLSISHEDPADMVRILRDVLENGMEQYGQRIAEAARYANNVLTAKMMAQNTAKVYEKVVNGHD